MTKRVGILTLPLYDNYGGIIQAAALYHSINEKGYDSFFIYKDFYQSRWRKLAVKVLSHAPFQNIRKIRSKYKNRKIHEDFIDKFLCLRTDVVCNKDELAHTLSLNKFDIVVVGSDQVWRMEYIDKRYYGAYFLDFVPHTGISRIAYGASFGVDYWQHKDKSKQVANWLSKFEAISVRERSGRDLCLQLGQSNTYQVVDPTLLVDKSFYTDIIGLSDIENTSSLVCYFLDDSDLHRAVFNDLYNYFGCDLEKKITLIYEKKDFQEYTIPDWLKILSEAEFILTDSYHGLIFSLIFNKPFLIVDNSERGSARFESLLYDVGLEDKRIKEYNSDNVLFQLKSQIDYLAINQKINSMRMHSDFFLNRALAGATFNESTTYDHQEW